jgi:hypothetical protein
MVSFRALCIKRFLFSCMPYIFLAVVPLLLMIGIEVLKLIVKVSLILYCESLEGH